MLRKFLDNIEEKILSNNKLKKFHPLHDALDTFLYTKNTQTLSAPYVRDSIDLKRTMIIVVLALLPSLIFGTYNVGLQSPENTSASFIDCFIYGLYRVLPMYLVVFAAGGLCEALFAVVRKHEINEGFLVTGFLIPLTMPPTVPLWMLALSTVFGVVIGKEIFGGTGKNFLNPALTGRAFLYFAYPAQISGDKVWIAGISDYNIIPEGYSGATALGMAAENGLSGITNSYTWMDAFLGNIPGSVGETSIIAIMIGLIILLATKVASYRIILGTFIGMIFMSSILNLVGSDSNPMFYIPWYWHAVIGSFAFGLVFMATEPVSGSGTNTGRWIYGMVIGVTVILIRVINPAFPEGMMLAILFANLLAPVIDHMVVMSNIKKRKALFNE